MICVSEYQVGHNRFFSASRGRVLLCRGNRRGDECNCASHCLDEELSLFYGFTIIIGGKQNAKCKNIGCQEGNG